MTVARRHRRPVSLALVGILATLVQAAYSILVSPRIPNVGDAKAYHLLGKNLAAGRGYIRPFDFKSRGALLPTAEFPPGFPTLLAGLDALGIDSVEGQRRALALVGGGTAILVVLVASRWFRWRTSLAIGLIAGIHPAMIQPGAALLAESLFALCGVALLLLALRAVERPTLVRVGVLGFVGGLATLVRSEGAILAVLLGLVVVVAVKGAPRMRASIAGVLLVSILIAPGAWMIRNLTTFDEPVLLSNNLGSVLAGANCEATYFGDLVGYWLISDDCFRGFEGPALRSGDESTAARELQRDGLSYARDNLGALPRVAATRVLRTFQLYEPEQQTRLATFEGRDRRTERITSWLEWMTYPFVVVGAAVLVRRRSWAQLAMLVIPVAVVVGLVAVTYGHVRFRISAEVPMLLLAALGIRALARSAGLLAGDEARADPSRSVADTRAPGPPRELDPVALRHHWRWGLLLVVSVALIVRVGYVLLVVGDDPPMGDAIYYSAQAETITRGTGFEHPFFGEPAADHPPATAVILSVASIGGGDPLFEQRMLMALLGTGAVVAIAYLGREVGRTHVGLVAGAMAAVYPGLWINDGLAMAETPTALITALLLLAAIRWHRGAVPGWVVGVLGGLAVLTRAELGLLLGLLTLPVVFAWIRRRGADADHHLPNVPMSSVAWVVVAAALVVAPWTIRNLMRFEEPVLISTNDGLTLLGANCESTYYTGEVGFWDLGCAPPVSGDQSEVSSQYRALAIDYATDNLARLPTVVVARVGRVWGVYQPMDMVFINQGEGRPQPATRLAIWGWWLLAPLAAIGLGALARRRGPWWVLLAPAVAVTITAMLTYGIPRFRVPAEVALLVAAATAVVYAARRVAPDAVGRITEPALDPVPSRSAATPSDAIGDAPPGDERQRLDDDRP